MKDQWIQVYSTGNAWNSTTVYVNPLRESAKIYIRECVYWGYHDESEWDEAEHIVSVEQALARVYPDAGAIERIQQLMGKKYKDALAKLAGKDKK